LVDLIITGRIQPAAEVDGLERCLTVLDEILIPHMNMTGEDQIEWLVFINFFGVRAYLPDGVVACDGFGLRRIYTAGLAGFFADSNDQSAGQSRHQELQWRRSQKPSQEPIARVIRIHLIAVLDSHRLVTDIEIGRALVHSQPELISPIVAEIKIVVAFEVVDLDTFVPKPHNLVYN